MPQKQYDWFAANAPKPPQQQSQQTDWFAANAPGATRAQTPQQPAPTFQPGTAPVRNAQGQWGSQSADQILRQQAGLDPNAPLPSAPSRTVSGAWQGVKDAANGLFNTVAHPIDTAAGMYHNTVNSLADAQRANQIGDVSRRNLDYLRAVPIVGSMAQTLGKDMAAGNYAGAIAQDVTANGAPVALGALGGGALKALPKVAGPVANLALGTAKDAYEGDPGMAAAQNSITGFTPRQILRGANKAIPKVAGEYRGALGSYSGPNIDIGNSLAGPFDEIRSANTNPVTGAADPAQLANLNRVQSQITHVPDPFTGKPTTALRPLNSISPLDANDLKSSLYGRANYDSPYQNSLSNQALKRALFNVKSDIGNAVPESVPSGNNLHNLMALRDQIQRGEPAAFPLSKSGAIRGAVRGAGTGAASALFKIGDAASSPIVQRLALPARVTAQASALTPQLRRQIAASLYILKPPSQQKPTNPALGAIGYAAQRSHR